MELKDYQKETLEQVTRYIKSLSKNQEKYEKFLHLDVDIANTINAPKLAWYEIFGEQSTYYSKKNGLGENLPNFCLKVPTGGGKTLLATHTIDIINSHYRKKKRDLFYG
ncbi:DEAD/DEAH box helicase family protein [Bacillus coahuilensis]|uniref:DEAD/DEAH box helicase family protein n=1 Tax=Bacillus coahuilensis TaxID=408580 RepID=UPI000B2F571E|nr:DEAD/DEAH box helicase family protein [Bacillus coahuilensis]